MRSGRGDERPGLARGRADRARLRSRDLRGPALSRCLPLKESGALVVFAKEPRPGFVKTRMSPALSPEQAAELYAVLLEDVLAASAAIAVQLGLEAVLAVHPPEACEALAHRAPGVFRAVAQRGASLGERMAWAVTQMAAAGARRVPAHRPAARPEPLLADRPTSDEDDEAKVTYNLWERGPWKSKKTCQKTQSTWKK